MFKKYDLDFDEKYDASKYKVLEVQDVNYINKAIGLLQKLFRVDVIEDDYDDYNLDKNTEIHLKENSEISVIKFRLSDESTFKSKK